MFHVKHSGNWSEIQDAFVKHCKRLGLSLTAERLATIEQAACWLARLAQTSGVSAYDSPADALLRGMTPGLAYFKFAAAPHAGRLADLGAGAGALGATIAILAPRLQVHLLDRAERAVTACELLVSELGMPNLQARRVDVDRHEAFEPRYEAVAFRAIAPGKKALALARSVVAPGGFVAAWHRDGDPVFAEPPCELELVDSVGTVLPGLVVTGYRMSPP